MVDKQQIKEVCDSYSDELLYVSKKDMHELMSCVYTASIRYQGVDCNDLIDKAANIINEFRRRGYEVTGLWMGNIAMGVLLGEYKIDGEKYNFIVMDIQDKDISDLFDAQPYIGENGEIKYDMNYTVLSPSSRSSDMLTGDALLIYRNENRKRMPEWKYRG